MDDATASERGFSLIELLVYSMLLLLIVAFAGGMMISVIVNSKSVNAVSEATSAGQLAIDSINSSIRNSSDFQLTNPSGTDQLLIARAASTSGPLTWGCVAWYYSASGSGSIRLKRSPTAIPSPTGTELATWTLLVEGVRPLAGTTIFSATARQITVGFSTTASDIAPVGITSAAMSRAGASGSVECF